MIFRTGWKCRRVHRVSFGLATMSKRTHDSSSSAFSPQPAKRSKASQACLQCRKHKTRCELLDGISAVGSLTCHRCKVLNTPCSFGSSNIIHLPPSQSRTILVTNPVSQTSAPSPALEPSLHLNNKQLPSPASSGSSARSSPRDYYDTVNNNVNSSTSARSVKHVKELLSPEDLVPDSNVPWGPAVGQGDFDWTAVPILAIQELASKNNPYPSIPHRVQSESESDRNLHSILSKDQITRLLDIFELRYAPWLCLSPRRLDQTSSPLLDLIRCTVAARHLDALTRASVSPRLQRLTEIVYLNHLLGSDPNIESVEALLILSLWSPLTNAGYSVKRDGTALASTAVHFATNLGLPEASALRAAQVPRGSAANGPELNELTMKTRLWLLVSTTESMQVRIFHRSLLISVLISTFRTCMGTGRTPVSRTAESDLKFIDPTSIKDNETARDIRLGFASRMLDAVEQGCKIRLRGPSHFESFYIESRQVMRDMQCIESFMKPFPMVSQYERFYFDMVLLQFNGWSLVLVHHFLRELRTGLGDHNGQSWTSARYKGAPMALIYGHDAISYAQNVLSIFLSQSETALLAAAPDFVYILITFAATWIVISNISIQQLAGANLGWANDKLIALVAEKLSHIAHSPEHLPAQCAHMIMRLIHAWETRYMPKSVSWKSFMPGKKWEMCVVKAKGMVEVEAPAPAQGEEGYSSPSPRLMPQMSAERTTAELDGTATQQQRNQSSAYPSLSSSSSSSDLLQDETLPLQSHQDQAQPHVQPPPDNTNLAVVSGIGGLSQEWADILMVDASFWATFMENLNSETPTGIPT
ncbi:hypothetical protein D9757_001170 [Collybiopsis confluens]|uniref:Zn(2)-C6 fungal-type domain-containing protein n=1 Tax=Collybiopsis confluens TaxID=2823264 RepID=A0A8H5I105_9AGAR|nr:hypothetical protein D9757_001170 [Collybiopsis confluens]